MGTQEITEIKQKVLLIKYLIEKGYKDKHICMIAQANQPYVSKVRHERIHAAVQLPEDKEVDISERQLKRIETLNRITSLPEFITSGGTNKHDLMYIQVLRFFMVDKEKVYNLYFHLSKKHFSRLWSTKDVDIRQFDSTIIGIERYDYLDLIIDFFIK